MSDEDMIRRGDAIAAHPIETAPKDGTMLRLLVDYTDDGENPLEDEHQAWTIGFNQLSDTEVDVWELAGWSWEQDCFTAGAGNVIGWLPFHADAIPAVQPSPDVAAAAIVVADAIDADMQSFNALVQGFEARPNMPVRHFFSKSLRHYAAALARVKGGAA